MSTLYESTFVQQNRAKWKLYKDLYEGDHDTMVNQYLWRHENEKKPEGKDLLITRQERTRYLNLSEISISVLRSLFFTETGEPNEELVAFAEKDLEDIDRDGNDISSFLSEKVFTSYVNQGAVALLADAPLGKALNQAQQNKLRPFIRCLDILDVKDFVFEKKDFSRLNKLNMFRHVWIEEKDRDEDTEPVRTLYSDAYRYTPAGVVVRRYKGPDLKPLDDASIVKEWTLLEEIPLKQKEIPVVLWFGQSWMKDASQEILRHFNLRSALDNVNHYQGYKKLWIKGGATMSDDQRKAVAEYIIGLLGDGQEIVSVEDTDPIGLEKAVKEAREDALRAALNQLRSLPSDSREGMSQDATIEQRRDTFSLVKSSATELQNILNRALYHYATFKDASLIENPDNFKGAFDLNVDAIDFRLSELLESLPLIAQELDQNPLWKRAHLEKVVRAFRYGKVEEEEIVEALNTERADTNVRSTLLGALGGDEENQEAVL